MRKKKPSFLDMFLRGLAAPKPRRRPQAKKPKKAGKFTFTNPAGCGKC